MLLRELASPTKRLLSFLVLIAVGTWNAAPLLAQESTQGNAQPNSQAISDLIRDHGMAIAQIGPFDKVESDINRLLSDLSLYQLGSMADKLLPGKDVGLNMNTGATFYINESAFDGSSVGAFQISDREAVLKSLGAKEGEFAAGKWVHRSNLAHQSLEMLYWPFSNDQDVRIEGESLLIGDRSSSFTDELLDAELLQPRLHATTKSIVDLSGLSMMMLEKEAIGLDDFEAEDIVDYLEIDLSESEKEWLVDFAEVVRNADIGSIGLQYHEQKALELRTFIQLEKEISFKDLIDVKAAKAPWKADLGFETENLVFLAGFKMDTFTSSAAPRLIPQAVAGVMTPNNMSFMRGNMIRVLVSLCGDSWNELSAARIALYHREADKVLGELTMIGVLDSKDPQQVLTELQRIGALTSPMQNEERKFQRDEEIRKLVEQLQSSDASESNRAYTRIKLVGEPAREALRAVLLKTEDQALKSRIGYLINMMDREKNRSGHAVSDAMFWTTLSPGLELKQNVGTLGDYPLHQIELTPDPSKTEEEVIVASKMMAGIFGEGWNKVSIVEVRDHFVFMLGSDQAKLKRIVDRTSEGKSDLAKQLEGVGHSSKVAQLQVWCDALKVVRITGQYTGGLLGTKPEELAKLQKDDQRLAWMGLSIEEQGLGADLLVPIGQLIPFVYGFGF